jgi:hypothetical protein
VFKLSRCFYAVGFIASGALFFGCGGGGDEPPAAAPVAPPDEPVITQSALIDQGNRICAEVNAAVGTIEASGSGDPATLQAQLATIYDGLAERLEALGEPSDGAAPVAVISAARELGDSGGSTEDLRSAAQDYGLDECAEAPSAPDTSGNGAGGDSGDAPDPAPAPAPPAPAPAPAPPSGGGSGGAGGPPSGGVGPG